jgi:membrane carboxypeptidase/penicillin-binding protein
MRLIKIRRAQISTEDREMYEHFGVSFIQIVLSVTNSFEYKGKFIQPGNQATQQSMLLWLTEQHDLSERKESWLLLMEIAITVLVAAELFISVYTFLHPSNAPCHR